MPSNLSINISQREFALCLCTIILIAASLFGFGNWFVHAEYTALYLYEFFTALFGIAAIVKILFIKDRSNRLNIVYWLFLAYVIYIVVHGLCIARNFNPYHLYMLVSGLLIWSLTILVDCRIAEILFKMVMILGGLEAGYCLLQGLKIVASLNPYFEVTGTVGNPNVTAMFLAMVFCLVPYVYSGAKKGRSNLLIFVSILIIIALIILQCRTAWLGLTGGLAVYLYHKGLFKSFWRIRYKTSGILCMVFISLMLLTAGFRMYQSKKASADGRKLIWKISAMMIQNHPLTGTGFGEFEKHYNRYQAGYFEKGYGTPGEKQYADHVNMAYNELLQQGVNGGIPAMLILAAFFFFTIAAPLWRKTHCNKHLLQPSAYFGSYSALVCLCIMSVFNFTLQAIPVMVLTIICITINCNALINTQKPVTKGAMASGIALLILPLAVLLLINVLQTARAAQQTKLLLVHRDADSNKWKKLLPEMAGYQSYRISYGNVLYQNKNYSEALKQYQFAQKLCSEKNLYLRMADCYEKTGNIGAAVETYTFLSYLQPVWLLPKYRLLQIYGRLKQTEKAIQQAKAIISIKPKVVSQKSRFYQHDAMDFLAAHKSVEKFQLTD